jgi:phosphate transport system permease protein
MALQSSVVVDLVVTDLPPDMRQLPAAELNLVLNDVKNLASGNIVSRQVNPELQAAADHYKSLQQTANAAMAVVVLSIATLGGGLAWRAVAPKMRARNRVEWIVMALLVLSSTIAIFTTIGIVLSVLFEAIRFFNAVPLTDFLFGLEWSPQIAMRADQAGSSGAFGAVPLFAGTMMISFIAMLVAVPIGLMAAIYLSEYAGPRLRAAAKPVLEVLAGIPTVVYGFFALTVITPSLQMANPLIHWATGDETTGFGAYNVMAAGIATGIMILPIVCSLAEDALRAVPRSLREGALALGGTRFDVSVKVVVPAALSGIIAAFLLAITRAIGETMIVALAAGGIARLAWNPTGEAQTMTAYMVQIFLGDAPTTGVEYKSSYAVAATLFVMTLALTMIGQAILRRFREAYD